MGNMLGRAVRSGNKRTLDPAAAAQALSIREKEVAQAAVLRSSVGQVAEQEIDLPEESGDELRKLVRAIESRPLDLYINSKDKASMRRRIATKEQKEAALVGRLDTQALRAALEDIVRAAQLGQQIDVAEVARRYGADEKILEQTLKHASLAPVERASDGRLIAKAVWPSAV